MAVGNLNDLGAMPGMPSVPSLRNLIAARADFPLIERGRYGKAFVIDLDVAAAFVRANWSDGRSAARPKRPNFRQLDREARERAAQPQLSLLENDDA